MIHPKISSPIRTPQRKRRSTNSGRSSGGSKGTEQRDVQTPPAEPVPIRYFDSYKREKAQAELGGMSKKKKTHPIAPDALIPNSSYRTVFKRKEIKPIEIKAFQLRLDILVNLQNQNPNWHDDDDNDEELMELDDPDAPPSKSTQEKKPKVTLVSRPKFDDDQKNNKYWTEETMPDLFKRLQNEPWWKQSKEEKPNLRSMLIYLNEILKLKQTESYESACYYVVEIFRTYGIEPAFVNQILEILLNHLTNNTNGGRDVCTVRTIAQFMIERKDIIVRLLEYALKCQPKDNVRSETVNAIKFITDFNNTEGIDLVLEHMSVVYDAPEDNFSLKVIIKELERSKKTATNELVEEEKEVDTINPLLKKISEERWFPRGNTTITLDYVLDAILTKLPDATKTLIKTLTTHLIQLQRVLGYSKEQYDRVAKALISILEHTDADYRLLAATSLANLGQETKAIDLALLNSFANDSRVLVRTECCDSLKKLTGITSETVLKDCVDDIPHLEALPEENFSLQNYLKEKNRLPTPIPMSIKEEEEEEQIPTEEIEREEMPIEEIKQEEASTDEIKREEIPTTETKPEEVLTNEIERKEIPINVVKQEEVRTNETKRKEIPTDQIKREKTPTDQIQQGKTPTDEIQQGKIATDQIQRGKIATNEIQRGKTPTDSIEREEIKQEKIVTNEIKREKTPRDKIDDVVTLEQIEVDDDVVPVLRSPSAKVVEQPVMMEQYPVFVQTEARELNKTPSITSTMTFPQPAIRVEINGLTHRVPKAIKSTLERSASRISRPNKSSISPRRAPLLDQKRATSTLLPNRTNMWDSYDKQNELHNQNEDLDSPLGYAIAPPCTEIDQHSLNDPIQAIIEEHKELTRFYRLLTNRRVLVPHKISMENVLTDQSHIMLDQFPPSVPNYLMNLSDLNDNQHQLNDLEFTQLLSALVIRAIQVHKQHEKSSPGMHSPSYSSPMTVSQTYLHSTSSFQQSNLISSSSKLPSIASQRPTTRQFARIQSNIQAKAGKDGINLHKAQSMEGVLSSLLKSGQELSKSTMTTSSTAHRSSSRPPEITHATLLIELLKSQGVTNSESYLQKVIQTYPKFVPILNTKIPSYLVSIIWNDLVTKEIASIFGNKQEPPILTITSLKRTDGKPSFPTPDETYIPDAFDYSSIINRTDVKKKFLPTLRGSKMNLPRHVLKFGFREIDADPSESSSDIFPEENRFKSRKRRVYMHMLFEQSENSPKNPLQPMVTPEYQTTSFLPIVARPPLCH